QFRKRRVLPRVRQAFDSAGDKRPLRDFDHSPSREREGRLVLLEEELRLCVGRGLVPDVPRRLGQALPALGVSGRLSRARLSVLVAGWWTARRSAPFFASLQVAPTHHSSPCSSCSSSCAERRRYRPRCPAWGCSY